MTLVPVRKINKQIKFLIKEQTILVMTNAKIYSCKVGGQGRLYV